MAADAVTDIRASAFAYSRRAGRLIEHHAGLSVSSWVPLADAIIDYTVYQFKCGAPDFSALLVPT
jgi:hypothetical protein